MPLLSLDAAGIPQTPGRSTGLIYQNVDPPYAMPNLRAVVHWLPDAPLRTSAIRAPGKVVPPTVRPGDAIRFEFVERNGDYELTRVESKGSGK